MLVIGIAGGTGSGKTTVVNKIIEEFSQGEVAILSHDSYYYDLSRLPLEERRKTNFDHPSAIEFDLMVQHVKALRLGKTIQEPVYSMLTCTRLDECREIHPRQVLLLEGILCLSHQKLRHLMDIKVYVECAPDLRLSRVIRRDMEERGRTIDQVLERYEKTVRPSHIQFIEPTKQFADIIIPQGGKNQVAIHVLTHYIKQSLNNQ
jgi:uridine kinase